MTGNVRFLFCLKREFEQWTLSANNKKILSANPLSLFSLQAKCIQDDEHPGRDVCVYAPPATSHPEVILWCFSPSGKVLLEIKTLQL